MKSFTEWWDESKFENASDRMKIVAGLAWHESLTETTNDCTEKMQKIMDNIDKTFGIKK